MLPIIERKNVKKLRRRARKRKLKKLKNARKRLKHAKRRKQSGLKRPLRRKRSNRKPNSKRLKRSRKHKRKIVLQQKLHLLNRKTTTSLLLRRKPSTWNKQPLSLRQMRRPKRITTAILSIVSDCGDRLAIPTSLPPPLVTIRMRIQASLTAIRAT